MNRRTVIKTGLLLFASLSIPKLPGPLVKRQSWVDEDPLILFLETKDSELLDLKVFFNNSPIENFVVSVARKNKKKYIHEIRIPSMYRKTGIINTKYNSIECNDSSDVSLFDADKNTSLFLNMSGNTS